MRNPLTKQAIKPEDTPAEAPGAIATPAEMDPIEARRAELEEQVRILDEERNRLAIILARRPSNLSPEQLAERAEAREREREVARQSGYLRDQLAHLTRPARATAANKQQRILELQRRRDLAVARLPTARRAEEELEAQYSGARRSREMLETTLRDCEAELALLGAGDGG